MIRRLCDFKCERCKYVTTAIYTDTYPSPKVRCVACPGVAYYQANVQRAKRCYEIDQRQRARGKVSAE